jgi:hypothetical protein
MYVCMRGLNYCRKSCSDIHFCIGFPVRLLGEAVMVFIYQKAFRI